MKYKDIIERACKTFIEAFIPVFIGALTVMDINNWDASKSALYSTILSACAAGISAVWNMVRQYIQNKQNDQNETKNDEIEDCQEEGEIDG